MKHMKPGETRQIGVVIITRLENKYQASCSMCSWSAAYDSAHTIEWLAFVHNRNFQKEGCKDGQTKQGG